MSDNLTLPTDVTQLQGLVVRQKIDLRTMRHEIEHLKFQLAKLRRFRFGQSSERLEGIEQLVLSLDALAANAAPAIFPVAPVIERAVPQKGQPVRRKHLPEHFERFDQVIEPSECACPGCGGPLGVRSIRTAGSKDRDFHGDPADPAQKALFAMLDHRAGTRTFTAHREKFCRGFRFSSGLKLEGCLSLAVVPAVPDF